MLNDSVGVLSEPKLEDVNEASILLLSPEKPYNSAPSSSRTLDSYESDLNRLSFSNEVGYFEYIPSEFYNDFPIGYVNIPHPGLFEDYSLSPFSLNSTDEVSPYSLTPESAEDIMGCAEVLQVSTARKTSVITLDESISSQHIESRTCNSTGMKCGPLPGINSLKISIGSFNSVNQITDLHSNGRRDPKPAALTVAGTASNSKGKCCNCKKSKCLKLYCECFANGTFCQGCNCVNCHNTAEHEEEVLEAKNIVSEKNPLALKRHCSEETKRTNVCCNCSRSGCLKKYCECFKMGKKCGPACNCVGCKNTTALRTISYKKYQKMIKKRKTEVM